MDKKRILAKFKELESYLDELESVKPGEFEEYLNSIEKKRSCERILQISIETVLDICNILVSSLKLGIPAQESDIFIKLENKKVISKRMAVILDEMKGFRNIIVHKYAIVNDELVFEIISERLGDFEKFKEEILTFINTIKKN
ncbi:MAG: DUF86 domain-containing protein [Nanoarchaeota archaeon]